MNSSLERILNSFSEDYGYADLSHEDCYELFVNHLLAYRVTGKSCDINSNTTDSTDAGIDGVLFYLDDELASSKDEIDDIISRNKKEFEVKIQFTQSTVSETFEKAKIASFYSGVLDFLEDKPKLPHGKKLKALHAVYKKLIDNSAKIRGGRPNCELVYCAGTDYKSEAEISGIFDTAKSALEKTDCFSNVQISPVGLSKILRIWKECTQSCEAKLQLPFGKASAPECEKIPEAYLAIVRADEFVKNVLSSEDGTFRKWIFEDNVRAFLGNEELVNKGIESSIQDPEKRKYFSLLNNGVTVVASNIKTPSNNIIIEGFQIVNGCQTSHMLYENRENLGDATISVKFIKADDPDVIGDIIQATNKQTKIEDEHFYALEPITKGIEDYFKSITDADHELFFERRHRQYASTSYKQIRVFDLKTTFRAMCAMFLSRPDLAMRYPNQMFKEQKAKLFDQRINPIVFYTACYCLYRINIGVFNKTLPSNFGKVKWHALLAARIAIHGKKSVQMNSHNIVEYCKKIIDAFSTKNITTHKSIKIALDYAHTRTNENREKLTIKSIGSDVIEEVSKLKQAPKTKTETVKPKKKKTKKK